MNKELASDVYNHLTAIGVHESEASKIEDMILEFLDPLPTDKIVKELNEWAKEVYPNADNIKFEYRDTESVLGFYIEDESLFFEYHKPSKTYEQYDGENAEFTVPFKLVKKIIKVFGGEIE